MELNHALAGLSALAHEGRLALFRQLVRMGPDGMAAGALARAAGINFTTASAQLAVLSQAGLITSRKRGRSVIYKVDFAEARSLIAFLMEDCCQGRAEIVAPLAEITARAACCQPETETSR